MKFFKYFTILLITAVYAENKCYYASHNMEGLCLKSCDKNSLDLMSKLKIRRQLCQDKTVCCLKKEEKSVSELKCEEYSDAMKKINLNSDRIRSNHPHLAVIGFGNKPRITWSCTGALVSDKFVLTAAYCLQNIQNRYVHFESTGSDNVYAVKETLKDKRHDLALLKLEKPIKFTTNIQPSCLYTKNVAENHDIFAAGWTINRDIHKNHLQLGNNSFCNKVCDFSKNFKSDSQFCATGHFQNDGPLQFYDISKNLHSIVGVSTGKNCKNSGIYTKISKYIEWIESIVWINNDPYKIAEKMCNEYNVNNSIVNVGARIVGGKNAKLGEFPHMAAIGFGDIKQIQWLCGGSLISDRFVVTAAHCASHGQFGNPKYVLLGQIKLQNQPTSHVTKIYVPKNYKPPAKYNDIALLEIKSVKFTVNLKPACLSNFIKTDLIATGWGVTEYAGNRSSILQKVSLSISSCPPFKSAAHRYLPDGIIDTQICAGSRQAKDTCQGDSGGPLQFLDLKKNVYYVVGVTSFGSICGIPGLSSVYTNVYKFVPWIVDVVWFGKN